MVASDVSFLSVPNSLNIMSAQPAHNTAIAEQAMSVAEVQAAIESEKIRRARLLTIEQRLADIFELSDSQFGMMLAGAMHRLGTEDKAAGWAEVRRWMQRLDRSRDHGRYVSEKPSGS
jgi:hypothetical protein